MSAAATKPWRVDVLCEKWSEEAVDFARGKLTRDGITHVPGPMVVVRPKLTLRQHAAERILGQKIVPDIAVPKIVPVSAGISSDILRRIVGAPEETVEAQSNLLLNEGIQRLIDLAIAAVSNQVAANAWTSTTTYVGVGTSSTAEAATQTDLQAGGFYKLVNATFPSRSSQTLSAASDFTSAEANQVWAEWAVAAGASGVSGSGFTTGTINLNRKVAALGTKTTGTWTLTVQITIS